MYHYLEGLATWILFNDFQISFLPVEHTDLDNDQTFSRTAEILRSNNGIALTELQHQLSQTSNNEITVTSMSSVTNLSDLCDSRDWLALEHVVCPFASGLAPMDTILPSFYTVVEYRHYRLSDNAVSPNVNQLHLLHRLKSQIDVLHSTLKTFNCFTSICLLPFLATIIESHDALGN